MKIIVESLNNTVEDIIEIKSAKYLGDYSILIVFNDSSGKTIDFKPFLSKSLHPSISKYMDKALFQKFEIKDGNLNWNDYDLIFPVHELYEGKIN